MRSLSILRLPIVCLALAYGGLLPASDADANRRASDWDTDGRSDPVLITIEAASKALSWKAVTRDTIETIPPGSFGCLGDNIIMGDWLGRGLPQPGIVSLQPDGYIAWRIFDGNNELRKSFGGSGSVAVAGADFNGNGIADAALISLKDSSATWRLWLDPFVAKEASPMEISFGKRGDNFFYADPVGSGDWLGAIRRDNSGKPLIILKNPLTGEERNFEGNTAYFGMKGRPLPLRQPNGRDMLALSVPDGSRTSLYLQTLDGSGPSHRSIPASGEVLVGNFSGGDGEQLAFQTKDGFLVFDPVTKTTARLAAPGGIAIDEININLMGGSAEDWKDTGEIPASGPLAAVCARYSKLKFPEMLIKSGASGHISNADPRSSGYTVLYGTKCPRNLRKANIFYADGSYACSVGIYSIWSETHKPRLYGASASAPQHNSSRIARVAARKGNGKLYIQLSSARSGARTICSEFNATGRVGGVRTSHGRTR